MRLSCANRILRCSSGWLFMASPCLGWVGLRCLQLVLAFCFCIQVWLCRCPGLPGRWVWLLLFYFLMGLASWIELLDYKDPQEGCAKCRYLVLVWLNLFLSLFPLSFLLFILLLLLSFVQPHFTAPVVSVSFSVHPFSLPLIAFAANSFSTYFVPLSSSSYCSCCFVFLFLFSSCLCFFPSSCF